MKQFLPKKRVAIRKLVAISLGFSAVTSSTMVLSDSLSSSKIDDVIVSATRSEQTTLTTASRISTITRAQIKQSGAQKLTEVLQGKAGIQINDFYGDSHRASITLRGFGDSASSNTLVLVDGRRLNNNDIGAPDLNAIALDDIERIEVVQGSAGVLFGDQAVGGVINIISRKPSKSETSLKFSSGSFNNLGLHLSTSKVFNNGFNYRVSYQLRNVDNYRDNNETDYRNVFSKFAYDYSKGQVFAELQYIDDQLNTPGSLFLPQATKAPTQINPNFSGDFSNTRTKVANVGMVHLLTTNWSFESELKKRESDGVFRLSSVFGKQLTDSLQTRQLLEFTPRFIGVIPKLNNATVTIGADITDSDYKLSSQFGIQKNLQKQQSIYAQFVLPATNLLDVTLGVRYASVDNELSDSFTFITPETIKDNQTVSSFGLNYAATNNLNLHFKLDQNYRFAKVDEYAGAQPFPTPPTPVILKTQTGLSVETGLDWRKNNLELGFVLYQLDLDNELAFDSVNFVNTNIEKTQRQGFIGDVNWNVSPKTTLLASYSYTDGVVTQGMFKDKNIPFVSKNNAQLSVNYKISERWQMYSQLQGIGKRYLSGDFNNSLDKLSGYGLLNLKAQYQHDDFTLSLRVNNVLDKQYSNVAVVGTDPNTFTARPALFPSPEINFLLTAAWTFR